MLLAQRPHCLARGQGGVWLKACSCMAMNEFYIFKGPWRGDGGRVKYVTDPMWLLKPKTSTVCPSQEKSAGPGQGILAPPFCTPWGEQALFLLSGLEERTGQLNSTLCLRPPPAGGSGNLSCGWPTGSTVTVMKQTGLKYWRAHFLAHLSQTLQSTFSVTEVVFWSLSAGFLRLYLSGSEIAGGGLVPSPQSQPFRLSSSTCFLHVSVSSLDSGQPTSSAWAGHSGPGWRRTPPCCSMTLCWSMPLMIIAEGSLQVRVRPCARKLVCILDKDIPQEMLVLCVLSQPAPLESSHQPLCSNGPTSWRSEPGLTKAAAIYFFFCSWGSNHGNEIR